MFFGKNKAKKKFDKDRQKPVIKASICNGEQVAGFLDKETKEFEDVMLIRSDGDLEEFKEMYGIQGEIEKMY